MATDSESIDESIQASPPPIIHGYGFELPTRIQRSVPLPTTNSDPRECIDIIDDIYGFIRLHSVR